jgi:hypothetical protein
LKVAQTGFKSYVKAGLTVTINNVAREDVRMEVGGAADSVTITADAAQLQTDRADVRAQLDKAQVTNLPITAGRNFQQLYKLIPGASLPADAHSDAGNPQRSLVTNFNGVSYSNNNTRLDGATVSYPWLPHIVAYVPSAEAVEVVNVVTNSFDAEQGHGGWRGRSTCRSNLARTTFMAMPMSFTRTARCAPAITFTTAATSQKHRQSVRWNVWRADRQEQALLLRLVGSYCAAAERFGISDAAHNGATSG